MQSLTNSLQRVAAGEAGAVRTCVDTYGDIVWTLIQRYGVTDAAAEQAVEDVFAELWQTASWCPDGASGERAFVASCVRRQLLGEPVTPRDSPVLNAPVQVVRHTRGMGGDGKAVLARFVTADRGRPH